MLKPVNEKSGKGSLVTQTYCDSFKYVKSDILWTVVKTNFRTLKKMWLGSKLDTVFIHEKHTKIRTDNGPLTLL